MNNIERYEQLILSALEIQNMRIQLKREIKKLSESMTARELSTRRFDHEDSAKALILIKERGVTIEPNKSRQSSTIRYKDVELLTCSDPNRAHGLLVEAILSEIATRDILS